MPSTTRLANLNPPDAVLGESEESVDGQSPNEFQQELIELFVRAVRVLGLPKSIGGIYGLLYGSPQALPLDAIVARLGISKGSASQGLRFLRNLGAVRPIEIDGDRRDHFEAVAELKQLATGFIRGELLPHLERGTEQLDKLEALAAADTGEHANFNARRVGKLRTWSRRGGGLLKIVERFLR